MNEIKIIILLFLCTITFEQSFAQNNIITGKVIDAETHKPIDLVSVYCSLANTITNEDGEFELKSIVGDSVIFSHIIYETKKLNVNNLPSIIELKPKIIQIAEITVKPSKTISYLTAVRNKYLRIIPEKEKDLRDVSYYYRQITSTNNIYNEFIECFFTAPTSARIKNLYMQEGRIANVKNDTTIVLSFTNFFISSCITPFQRENKTKKQRINSFLCPNFEKIYNIYLSKTIIQNKDTINIFNFKPNPTYPDEMSTYGDLYIRSKDSCIIGINAIITDERILNGDYETKKLNMNFNITYKDGIENYPIVETVKANAVLYNIYKGKSYTTNIKSILFAVNYNAKKDGKKIKFDDNLREKVLKSKYDAAFWDNNPIVKRTQIEQKVLDDFTRLGYFGNFELNK